MAYTTIDKPTDYFNTIIYTGDGTTKTITGVGFQPDFVWGKGRNSSSDHALIDSVRGATKELSSNATTAEDTNATSYLTGFTSDGYTVNSASNFNVNTRTQVNWNWLAGGTASSNTDGSITSTVSANTTAGFSIVSYTGTGSAATIGHGLGAVPKMIISKSLASGEHWGTYHASLGNGKALALNLTDGAVTNSSYWNNTTPTSSVWSVGTSPLTNHSNASIAYVFAEKKGYSKFGSYTGNGSTDGTFVYTGFKPAFVITKRSDGVVDWYMFDNKRQNPFNVINGMLRPSATSSELDDSSVYVDFLSNGFKWRGGNAGNNASGGSYIYMAFAESPFVTSTGIPTTAR